MGISYDEFIAAFLDKITEYKYLGLENYIRDEMVIGYMKRAISDFKHICNYDLSTTQDDNVKAFNVDIPSHDLDEILNIVSDGMVVYWLKQYLYNQELLENAINTRDFTTYSPAELLNRVGGAHTTAKKNYTQSMREYSYNTGDLTDLHL